MTKAAVLPVPFFARAKMSLPVRALQIEFIKVKAACSRNILSLMSPIFCRFLQACPVVSCVGVVLYRCLRHLGGEIFSHL
jgi:hypothetical protein